jgi:integrase
MTNRIDDIERKLDYIISLLQGNGVAVPASVLAAVSAPPFFDWLDEWFCVYKAPALADKGYKMGLSIAKHIKPHIENKPLDKVTSADITRALYAVDSERMRQMARSIYNQAFAKAVKLELIEKSPMFNVDTVKHDYENGRALTLDEQTEFLTKAVNNKLCPLYLFYLLTGCRRAEALSVRWSDISKRQLRIRGTKTTKAVRTLPLYPQLEGLLRSLPKVESRLFPYTVGKVRKNFERFRERLSFGDITIHDLRHTFATRCLESGVSMKTVQKWLGHSKYDTTANIYSHVTTEFEHEEMSRFSSKLLL